MLVLNFVNETSSKISEKEFDSVFKKFYKILEKVIMKKLGKRNGSVDLILVDDKKIRDLNSEYRSQDETTDVIAFAYLEVMDYKKEKGDVVTGDIFVSVDTAKRQAKERKIKLMEELHILFVHGMLHLFGFDHKTKKQEAEMEKWAAKVL